MVFLVALVLLALEASLEPLDAREPRDKLELTAGTAGLVRTRRFL